MRKRGGESRGYFRHLSTQWAGEVGGSRGDGEGGRSWGPGDAAAVGAELRKRLPWSGHPTGFYMASLIRARLGLDALVATTGDPFAFFRAYQRAVTQFDATDPDPADDAIPTAFSPAAMRTLDRLERGFRS